MIIGGGGGTGSIQQSYIPNIVTPTTIITIIFTNSTPIELNIDIIDINIGNDSLMTEINKKKNINQENIINYTPLDILKIKIDGNISFKLNCSFTNYKNLQSIEFINNTDKKFNILDNFFSNCSNLSEVKLPTNTQNIGNNAFLNCVKLKSIILPNSLISIGKFAFKNTGILVLNIPESVILIDDGCFIDSKIINLYINNNNTQINNNILNRNQNVNIYFNYNYELLKYYRTSEYYYYITNTENKYLYKT